MENLESQKLLQKGLKDMRDIFRLYIDKETKKQMKIKQAESGIKWQDKIRNFIKGELENERD